MVNQSSRLGFFNLPTSSDLQTLEGSFVCPQRVQEVLMHLQTLVSTSLQMPACFTAASQGLCVEYTSLRAALVLMLLGRNLPYISLPCSLFAACSHSKISTLLHSIQAALPAAMH